MFLSLLLLPIPAHCAQIIALPVSYTSPRPHHVSAQVNAEDGHSAQWQGYVGNNEEQEGGNLRDVAGQGVRDGFLQVVKDEAACGEFPRASGGSEAPFPTPAMEVWLPNFLREEAFLCEGS